MVDYNKAIEISSDIASFYHDRGSCKGRSDNFKEAILAYTKALELNPEYSLSYRVRGWAKESLKDLKCACEDWKKAAELGDEEAAKLLKEYFK